MITMKRSTLQRLVRFLMRALTRSEFIDFNRVPASGGVILAINHLSHLDTPLLFVNPVRPDITALVTTKYKQNKFVSWFTDMAEGIWIDRDIADFTAIRAASKVLSGGWALGIAPEGTRSKNGMLQEGKPGTILLAVKSGVPIVPVGITGTGDAFHKLSRLRRPHLVVRFGQPFTIPQLEPGERSEQLRYWTDVLMCRIAALLPAEYRGEYASHPLLNT
jgi:1-acyl-sn-glycerol-3-phosphate acyltransferase